MSRQRAVGDSSAARGGASLSSDAALHTTQLVQQLARSLIISERSRRHDSDVVPSEAQIHGAVRLCIRILTSHIGEPLIVEDEASVAQVIRTRLVKVSHASSHHHMICVHITIMCLFWYVLGVQITCIFSKIFSSGSVFKI